MRELRKKDREITNVEEIIEVIGSQTVLRLALVDGDMPYIIPLNYGYSMNDGKLCFYFHSAKVGTKFDIIEKNNKACFEIDCEHKLIEGKVPCAYSFEFSSVVGVGKAYIIEDVNEKNIAMQNILKHITKKDFEMNEKLLSIVNLWKLEVDEYKGKRRKIPTM